MLGATVALGLAQPLYAQAPAPAPQTDVNEIVVTARKREERLRDIPESIAAVSSETLERNAILTINDLGRQTPGLVLSRRQDNTANVVLRGVGSFGTVQGVGFYIDEVQNFTDTSARLEDIDHVEILKGPQGTLYGGSNIGGAIRYVAKTPNFRRSAQIKAEAGERDYYSIYGAANLPIIDGTLATRLSAAYSHDDGYLPNYNLGGQPNGEVEELALRGQLLFTPTANFRALLTVRHRNTEGSFGAYSRNNDARNPVYSSNTTIRPIAKTKVWAGVANLSYDFGPVALTSISSFTQQKRLVNADPDYTSLAFVTAPGAQLISLTTDARPTEVMTQEIRLTSAAGEKFDWILGVYAARLKNLNALGLNGSLSINNGPFIYYLDRKIKQEDVAVFGTANYKFGNFTLGGGLRALHTEYSYTPFITSGVRINPVRTQSQAFSAVLPKVSLSYKLESDTMIYASVAEGWESGKISVDANPAFAYDPEKAWTGEIGAKGAFADNVNYEVAAYYTHYSDRQIESRFFDSLAATIGTERIDNVGTSISKGVEASFVWEPVQDLLLTAAGGYLDATWKSGVFGYRDKATNLNRSLNLKGGDVPNSPRWNFNFGGTYSTPLTEGLKLELHADASYQSSFKYRLQPTGASNIGEERWVANARVALGDEGDKWELSARVENLFDERFYYEFAPQYFGVQNADGTCAGCHLGSVSAPRRFVAAASVKF